MFEEYPDILKPNEAMELLGISHTTMYGLFKKKEFPAFRLGGKLWRIYKKDLITYMDKHNLLHDM